MLGFLASLPALAKEGDVSGSLANPPTRKQGRFLTGPSPCDTLTEIWLKQKMVHTHDRSEWVDKGKKGGNINVTLHLELENPTRITRQNEYKSTKISLVVEGTKLCRCELPVPNYNPQKAGRIWNPKWCL